MRGTGTFKVLLRPRLHPIFIDSKLAIHIPPEKVLYFTYLNFPWNLLNVHYEKYFSILLNPQ